MTDKPLSVAFLWHMHQPLYKDPLTGYYRLPWVRLHGTKDYLDMVEILREFPAIRQTFNVVPSLLEQIVDYAGNSAGDVYLQAGLKPAAELTFEDKSFLLENYFLANWETMIRPFPRYYELLMKRGVHVTRGDLPRLVRHFSETDFLDLQVFFNLAWIDPLFRTNDPFLKTLESKGRGYTEEEKKILFEKQLDILRKIIPSYRQMAESGQIELSFSPFYHPILPLLCDTDVARVAMPGARLPNKFRHPEDAEKQISMGLEYFQDIFGHRPSGMWPSEGSVSEEVLKMASSFGLKWVCTDEGILSNSLRKPLRDDSGAVIDPAALYRPYMFDNVAMLFRDRGLSDLIGFVYSQWEPKKAAGDLIRRLVDIRNALRGEGPFVVPVILDGENAWEYYKNDGGDFFRYLYDGLSRESGLRTVTISEFLGNNPPGQRLNYLFPGSWINSNFGVWIGHEEDNMAWDYLSETREKLETFEKENPGIDARKAWKSLYAAEGSDWNWWYGDDHTTETQGEFDELFRRNLMKVYRELGTEVPEHLYQPIVRQDRRVIPTLTIRGFIRPKIDGLVTSYYEWYQGAKLDVSKSGGSMHKSESLLSTIYFGFDKENLFLRMDPKVSFSDFGQDMAVSIFILGPFPVKIVCGIHGEIRGQLFEKTDGTWKKVKDIAEIAVKDIFEISLPFSDLKAREKDELNLFISITRNGEEVERCPWRGYITVIVPTPDFEAMMWS